MFLLVLYPHLYECFFCFCEYDEIIQVNWQYTTHLDCHGNSNELPRKDSTVSSVCRLCERSEAIHVVSCLCERSEAIQSNWATSHERQRLDCFSSLEPRNDDVIVLCFYEHFSVVFASVAKQSSVCVVYRNRLYLALEKQDIIL